MKVRVFAADNSTPAPPPGMVYIPPGPFQMGDAFGEGSADEGPVQTVTLDGFYIEMFEVTNELWNGVRTWAEEHGYVGQLSSEGGSVETPVDANRWIEVVVWCNARSEMEGFVPCYYQTAAKDTVIRSINAVTESGFVNTCVNWGQMAIGSQRRLSGRKQRGEARLENVIHGETQLMQQ